MRNFVQQGVNLTLTAPAAVASGAGFLVGSIFAVASADAGNGETVVGVTEGVFDLAKTTGEAWTVGQKIYWDNTAKKTTTTSTSKTLIGAATKAAIAGATTGNVKLTGQV